MFTWLGLNWGYMLLFTFATLISVGFVGVIVWAIQSIRENKANKEYIIELQSILINKANTENKVD